MAAESVRIVSLPRDRASSDRVVTTPYTTAAAAHTTATRAPWSARKADKETSLESGSSRTHDVGAPCTHSEKAAAAAVGGRRRKLRECSERGGSNALARLLSGHPEAPGALRRPGLARLGSGRLLRRLGRGLLRWRLGRPLGVDHLQARERVAHRAELVAVARLEHGQQRPRALDGQADLLEVALGRLALRSAEPGLEAPEVEQADHGLEQDVVDRDPLHL